ncbi:hypothetical protein JEZ13_01900 [bacterium]|jgi:hypothetical protein|nr:hypothetical protein [bacterium]
MSVCEHHESLVGDIKDIKKKLDGNGRPGILERLSRVETKLNIVIWLNGLMAGIMIASVLKPIIGG